MRHHRGFTLIELLVVIAIIAILTVVVILTLNPAELLKQARDSNRLADMATINQALGVYTADVGSSVGSSNVIYLSIPDASATSTAGDQCQGLGLASAPLGYSYHCVAAANLKNIDATGWIPVNLKSISSGAPIGAFPVDATNSTSSRLYYAYATNGTLYEVTTAPESQKYKMTGSNDVVTGDGGTLAHVYEKGTKFGLQPLDYGSSNLIGYWTLDEGTGTVAYDYSGANATGSWNGTSTGTSGYYSAGKIGAFAGTFDGSSTYISIASSNAAFNLTNGVTMVAWVKLTASSTDTKVISKRPSYVLGVFSNNIPETEIFISTVSYDTRSVGGGTVLQNGKWYQLAGTYDGTTLKTYVNGTLDRQLVVGGNMDTTSFPLNIGKTADGANAYFPGLIDDARVYNRALSAAEIQALYNGGK